MIQHVKRPRVVSRATIDNSDEDNATSSVKSKSRKRKVDDEFPMGPPSEQVCDHCVKLNGVCNVVLNRPEIH